MQISARLRMHEDSAYEPRPHLKDSGEKRQLNVFRILRENEAGSSDCHRADAVLQTCQPFFHKGVTHSIKMSEIRVK